MLDFLAGLSAGLGGATRGYKQGAQTKAVQGLRTELNKTPQSQATPVDDASTMQTQDQGQLILKLLAASQGIPVSGTRAGSGLGK